jgi:lipopolysaccharide transport system permease protein
MRGASDAFIPKDSQPTRSGALAAQPAAGGEDMPVLVIEAKRAWVALDLRQIWQYRELLYFLTWRDVKVRYRQTLLGAAWAIIQPLFIMLIFTLFFGKLAKVPSDGIPYPLFAYAGLMPWMFFSGAIANSANSLVGNAHLVSKVYFPRMIIPGASVLAGCIDFAMAFVILLALMVWYQVPTGAGVVILPVLFVLVAILSLGVGMWLAALNVKYRDIRHAIPFLIQVWMFVTPIIYPASILPPQYRVFYAINPMAGIIEAFRVALFGEMYGTRFDWLSLGISASVALGTLAYAAYDFGRMENTFADLI